MSEERFLGFMQYERLEATGNEVFDDAYYHCSHDSFGREEQIALSRESAIAEALMEFSSRFSQGVGEGVLNVFTGAWDFLNAYADWQEKARNDFDAFDEENKAMSKAIVEAVQSEAFWISKAEAIAETLSTPEGLGRITGEILVVGVMSEIASVIEVTRGFSVIKQHNVVKRTAGEVNDWFKKEKGYDPPYKPGTVVHEFELAEDTVFMRVFPERGRVDSDWLVEYDEIAGLTRAEIKDKLSLPKMPDNIAEVHVPKGTKIRTGEINPLFEGKGGGMQFEFIQDYETAWFKNIKKLKD